MGRPAGLNDLSQAEQRCNVLHKQWKSKKRRQTQTGRTTSSARPRYVPWYKRQDLSTQEQPTNESGSSSRALNIHTRERPATDMPPASDTRSASVSVQADQSQASVPPGLRPILGYGSPMPPALRPTGDKRLPKLEIDSDWGNAESTSNSGEYKPKDTSSTPAQQEAFVHPLNRPAPEHLSTLQKSLPPTDDMSPRNKEEPHTTPPSTSHGQQAPEPHVESPRLAVPARAVKLFQRSQTGSQSIQPAPPYLLL